MNKDQFQLIQTIEQSDVEKAKFLKYILLRASQGYDYAVKTDAQSLQGELALVVVSEGHGTLYGRKSISRSEQRGGDLYTGIFHKFREHKTINDFDWSGYDKETSLYNE